MSIAIRVTASTLPSTVAMTSTMTVYGRRMAKVIGIHGLDLNGTPGGK